MSNSGPGGEVTPVKPEPPVQTIRILAATFDDGRWSVDLDVDDEPAEDPELVRFVVADVAAPFSATFDMPVEVLRRMAERIAEL